AEEDERPVSRPGGPSRAVQDGQEPHGEHEEAREVVVVLGPRAILGRARRVPVVHGHLLDARRREGGQARREDVADLGGRGASSGPPPATSTPTEPKAMDEKRWRSTGGHGRSRGPAAATVRCMSPPTHTLAAYWCTASIARRKPSYWSRAAAWLMAAAVTARRMVRPAKVAHPARDSVRRRSHRAATVSATQSRTRSTLDW